MMSKEDIINAIIDIFQYVFKEIFSPAPKFFHLKLSKLLLVIIIGLSYLNPLIFMLILMIS